MSAAQFGLLTGRLTRSKRTDSNLPAHDRIPDLAVQGVGKATKPGSQGEVRFPAGALAAQGITRPTNAEGQYECWLCGHTVKSQGGVRKHERKVHEE